MTVLLALLLQSFAASALDTRPSGVHPPCVGPSPARLWQTATMCAHVSWPTYAAPLSCHHQTPNRSPAVSLTVQRRAVGNRRSVDRRYYTFCTLERLQDPLRRRDVFVSPSERWSDPRAKLLHGSAWDAVRSQVCRTLGRTEPATTELQRLADSLTLRINGPQPAYRQPLPHASSALAARTGCSSPAWTRLTRPQA